MYWYYRERRVVKENKTRRGVARTYTARQGERHLASQNTVHTLPRNSSESTCLVNGNFQITHFVWWQQSCRGRIRQPGGSHILRIRGSMTQSLSRSSQFQFFAHTDSHTSLSAHPALFLGSLVWFRPGVSYVYLRCNQNVSPSPLSLFPWRFWAALSSSFLYPYGQDLVAALLTMSSCVQGLNVVIRRFSLKYSDIIKHVPRPLFLLGQRSLVYAFHSFRPSLPYLLPRLYNVSVVSSASSPLLFSPWSRPSLPGPRLCSFA